MSKNLDLKAIVPQAKKYFFVVQKHLAFIFVIVVLLSYVFVVWKISSLATVEPTQDEETAALSATAIPKVNKEAVSQIEALESTNAEVHSLFEDARSNPFQE